MLPISYRRLLHASYLIKINADAVVLSFVFCCCEFWKNTLDAAYVLLPRERFFPLWIDVKEYHEAIDAQLLKKAISGT